MSKGDLPVDASGMFWGWQRSCKAKVSYPARGKVGAYDQAAYFAFLRKMLPQIIADGDFA